MAAPTLYFMMASVSMTSSRASRMRLGLLTKIESVEELKDSKDIENGIIEISSGNFSWVDPKYFKIFKPSSDESPPEQTIILKNINIRLIRNELLMVIGKVGAGKSSLLNAMINEMVKLKGTVKKNGRVAFIPQEAFLLNDTVKNNIIFGQPFDEEKYNNVIKLCELTTDLEILPGGDETEIGERGINLSGGQKQRISIARAVYSDADIYLIDDALSALDVHVGKKIMYNVFISHFKNKTVVLATHHLNLLEHADRVCFMKLGEIHLVSTLELMKSNEEYIAFSKLAEKQEQSNNEYNLIKNKDIVNEEESIIKADSNIKIEHKKIPIPNGQTKEEKHEAGVLTKTEKRFTGQVGSKIYAYYISSAGIFVSICYLLSLMLSIFMGIATNWWVTKWTSDSFSLTKTIYLIVYGGLGASSITFVLSVSIFLGLVASRASINIFQSIVLNILKRPMSFFDTTPSGVVLNRCTGDINEVDSSLPFQYQTFLSASLSVAIIFVLASIASPLVIIVVLGSLTILMFSFNKYMKTATELKRLVKVSESPVISVTSELFTGASVIRGFNQTKTMIEKYRVRADLLHSSEMHLQFCTIWIRSRLEYTLKLIIILIVCLVIFSKSAIRYIIQ